MASIEERTGKSGKKSYRVKVRLKNKPSQTASFDSLIDAKQWSERIERKIKVDRANNKIKKQMPAGIENVVLRLPIELSNKLKSVAARGHRSDFIIDLLNKYFELNPIKDEHQKSMIVMTDKRYVSVKHIPKIYPAFNEGGIRNLIFNHEKHNFTKCFVRVGGSKKIVIDLDEFEKWVHPS